jgi:hypothetical protein
MSGRSFRLMRRMAFFFEMRRSSLFETNQRLRRTVLKIPLLATFLRKRLSSASCDSFGRRFTVVNFLTSLRFQMSSPPVYSTKKTRLTFMLSAEPGVEYNPVFSHR